jgi:hypothetical protein
MAIETTPRIPKSAVAGPEMAALAPFYRNWRWSGTIEAGGMGPGTPEMIGEGRAVSRLIQGGLWYACDFEQEQRLVDGTFVLRWQLHWVTGWDADAAEYRATFNDNYGHSGVMRGRLDGDRLIYESVGDGPIRLRLTWDVSDPAVALWTNETAGADGAWTLVESYRMTPAQPATLTGGS